MYIYVGVYNRVLSQQKQHQFGIGKTCHFEYLIMSLLITVARTVPSSFYVSLQLCRESGGPGGKQPPANQDGIAPDHSTSLLLVSLTPNSCSCPSPLHAKLRLLSPPALFCTHVPHTCHCFVRRHPCLTTSLPPPPWLGSRRTAAAPSRGQFRNQIYSI